MQRSKQHLYSITSSAMESSPGGTSMPSARAVLRLMTNSNLVDCSTGRSAGFAPLRMCRYRRRFDEPSRKSGKKPADIPGEPHNFYANDGWSGMGDWLGTGAVANQSRQYRSFEEARAFVRGLGLTSNKAWRAYCKSRKKPDDIPSNPANTYAEAGWAGWGDWLGTGIVASYLRKYRPFEEACTFVRGLGLKSQAEWKTYCNSGQKPTDIPSNPNLVYAGVGYAGWGDWLGTGRIADQLREYWPFEKARAFVRGLGLKSQAEWYAYCKSGKKPSDIRC
jgi:hypothetical protein